MLQATILCIISNIRLYNVPDDGQNCCPKHVELIWIINKPLLLHLVGFSSVPSILMMHGQTNIKNTPARVWLQLLVNSAACILLRRGQNVAESLHDQHSLVWGYQGQDGVKYWCRVSREITLISKRKDFVSHKLTTRVHNGMITGCVQDSFYLCLRVTAKMCK